ncbi:SDR family NAD(P)-dependent oxidoreductase [Novosphingobium sp. Gsoil 351]|uniref:SDR family NAD(P)-dependent oxidoreductase n=1 Tax=Novosphingobium sp. Gsoil 351 TaxID=2675225 RepID=UPI0012B4A2B3|nr:SDR family NAD(P)-dependent oxidoreductase [Novosphingobium sp. Gsoil 351]QGN53789.1 SDR family NAD(P)-dependent oxidoreductase [Novosphingobium sp. Gsoil 351]
MANPQEVRPFSGQVALVTGASKGIGAATAGALAAAGAHVILTSRDAKALEAVEEAIYAAGGTATIAPVDLADPEGAARLAAGIGQRWDALDILVLGAAYFPQLTPVTQLDSREFNKTLTLNLMAQQAMLGHCDRMLKASKDARIIALTSSVGQTPRAFWGAYAASKAALEALLVAYAEENRAIGHIRVAIVDPGATRTAMRARAYPGEDPASVKPPEAVAERLVALLGEPFLTGHRERVNQSA